MKTTKTRRGFTLVELLTVVAIIGILASIVMVTIGPIMAKVRQVVAANDAKQIASAYIMFSNGQHTIRSDKRYNSRRSSRNAQNVTEWAAVLANKSELNEGKIWFIDSDESLSGITFPPAIVDADKNIVSEFASIKPKSWAVVSNLPTTASGSTSVPVLWTRGLRTDGTWSEDSPWGGSGGHVAYMDGHVVWYNSGEVEFTTYRDKSKITSNYKEAISPRAKVLEDKSSYYENETTDDSQDLLSQDINDFGQN